MKIGSRFNEDEVPIQRSGSAAVSRTTSKVRE
jgi:hypothetical protein